MSVPLLDHAVTLAYPAVAATCGAVGAAATIVLCTAALRLLLHPLTRAAVRGERQRAALAPKLRALQEKHRRDPARLRAELAALYAGAGISPLAGIAPLLLQAPAFLVWFRVFTAPAVGGRPNALLAQALLGTPLSAHLAGGGLVFVPLLAVLALLGVLGVRRARRVAAATGTPAPSGLLALLPFTSLVSAALLPLAAVLYLVTTLAWSAAENALLRRGLPD